MSKKEAYPIRRSAMQGAAYSWRAVAVIVRRIDGAWVADAIDDGGDTSASSAPQATLSAALDRAEAMAAYFGGCAILTDEVPQ